MSWAIFSMMREMGALEGRGAIAHCRPSRAQLIALPGSLRRAAHARTGRASAAARHARHGGRRDRCRRSPARALFTPFTPIFNATGQPAISLPLFQGEDGLPLGVQLVGRPAQEASCWPWRRRSKRRIPGMSVVRRCAELNLRPAQPASARHDAEGFGVGGAARGDHRDLHQLGLIPGGECGGPRAPRAAAATRDDGVGTCTSACRLSSDPSTIRTISLWVSVCAPASSKRRWRGPTASAFAGPPGRPSPCSTAATQSATSWAQIGWRRRSPFPGQGYPAAARGSQAVSTKGRQGRR